MPTSTPFLIRHARLLVGGAAALALWGLAWTGAILLDHHTDLANQAMLFVIAPVLASVWLPAPAAFAFALACMLSFNWGFVPPRGSLAVDAQRHAVLLLAMLVVSWLIAGLVARLRAQAAAARDAANWAARLQAIGEALRDSADPQQQAHPVAQALAELGGAPAALMLLRDELPPSDQADAVWLHGELNADEHAGLWLCLRQSQAFGPGTGRHGEQPAWYLPLRSRGASYGAALVRLAEPVQASDSARARAQALCDLLGVALQRAALARQTEAARALAQTQSVRNALLASISHDYRTPLAVMLGAASSLQAQGERLSAAQRERLAGQIVDEIEQLSRMTDNTLQLARLDAPGVALRLDWESAEEVVGTALAHARRRDAQHRVRARLEPGLPLLRCDAMLLSQMLDNLIDNALKYSDGLVELVVRQQPAAHPGDAAQVVLAVRDRGAGIAPAERARIFEVFQRGEGGTRAARGAGVGLAVCRAIAQAHGGELKLRARAHGGSAFELWLPMVPGADGGARRTRGRGADMIRVLLVEDDRELRATLRDALALEGYEVHTAASLSEGLALWAHARPAPDVVLLDLGLPDGDGETLLATLRRRDAVPVLVISARQADGQKIRLLDAGADDYLVKPFSIGELLARLRVALRHRGTALKPALTRYEADGLLVDLAAHRVTLQGEAVHLTPTEFKLLARLVRSAGQVVTHRQLLADVWGEEFTEHTHYLRLYMGQLRAKLEADPADPGLLLTEPGVGYRLAPEPEPPTA